jgi:hypothetical protein
MANARVNDGPLTSNSWRRTELAKAQLLSRWWFDVAGLVFCPGNSLTKSGEFLEDGVSGSGPHEGS